MSDVRELMRSCISRFIQGAEFSAIIDAMSDEAVEKEKTRIAAMKQLNISTASSSYLRKQAANRGFTEPEELGLSDFTFRKLAIDTWAVKQVTTVVHDVLETFYGPDAVRAYVESTAEPFALTDGMTLNVEIDKKKLVYVVQQVDFPAGSLPSAKAKDIAAAMTKSFRNQGTQVFAEEFIDTDQNTRKVRLFSGSKGPTSYIKVLGGDLEVPLQFDKLIETVANPATVVTWTNWQVTRNGNIVRYTWGGNQDPGLDKIKIGDIALVYGSPFNGVGLNNTDLRGDWEIVGVNPDGIGVGYFEVYNESSIISAGETISINQASYNALRFYRQKTERPNFRERYALAWEPRPELLRIYLPATTRVIERGLIGASHLKLKESTKTLEGTFGSDTSNDDRITILNQYAFSYYQEGYDVWGFGGTVIFQPWQIGTTYLVDAVVEFDGLQYRSKVGGNIGNQPDMSPADWEVYDTSIDYIRRDLRNVIVVMKNPHGIHSLASDNYAAFNSSNTYNAGDIADQDGFLYESIQYNPSPSVDTSNESFWALYADDTKKSDAVVSITDVPEVTDESPTFIGSYMYDPDAGYMLTTKVVYVDPSNTIRAGESYRDIIVTGMSTASIPDQSGYVILDLNKDNQEVAPIIGSTSNSVIFNPAYRFKFSHEPSADISLLSANRYISDANGKNYPMYETGVYPARQYCQDILNTLTALGIHLEIIILYPDDIGWGYSEAGTRIPYENTEDNPTSALTDEFHADVVWVYGP